MNGKLQNVGENLLRGSAKLKQVDFLNNPCINFRAFAPEQIQDIKQNLPLKCAPMSETTTIFPSSSTSVSRQLKRIVIFGDL